MFVDVGATGGRRFERSAALGELAPSLAASAVDARELLCRALGDPALAIAYWLPVDQAWVDAEGRRAVVDSDAPGVTVVWQRGQRVAALLHDPALARDRVESVAGTAVLSLENERLQLALRARLEEQEALRRVATLVARHHAPDEVLELVTEEVARHLDADAAMTARYDGPGVATVVADWAAPGLDPFPIGRAFDIGNNTALAKVQATRAPARIDSYEGLEGAHPEELRALGMRAGVGAPIVVDGELWGAVAAGSAAAPFTADAEQRLGAFAELVAQAIANVDARIKLRQSRARIVAAADDARRKIERDLHDGAQQRLVGLALSLRLLSKTLEPEATPAIDACIRELLTALQELRELARGIHPAVLTEHGLKAAVEALAARSPVPVLVDADLSHRLSAPQEVALYFVAAEALTNVAKYARASSVDLHLRSSGGWVDMTITDDGVGGARVDGGSGLRGLSDRVDAVGGRLSLESTPGIGTTVRARVPIGEG